MIDPTETGSPCEARAERERFVRNLLAEEDSAARDEALAGLERDLRQAAVYRRLAAAELDRADYWRARLRAADHADPKRTLPLPARVIVHLARWFGSVPGIRTKPCRPAVPN